MGRQRDGVSSSREQCRSSRAGTICCRPHPSRPRVKAVLRCGSEPPRPPRRGEVELAGFEADQDFDMPCVAQADGPLGKSSCRSTGAVPWLQRGSPPRRGHPERHAPDARNGYIAAIGSLGMNHTDPNSGAVDFHSTAADGLQLGSRGVEFATEPSDHPEARYVSGIKDSWPSARKASQQLFDAVQVGTSGVVPYRAVRVVRSWSTAVGSAELQAPFEVGDCVRARCALRRRGEEPASQAEVDFASVSRRSWW